MGSDSQLDPDQTWLDKVGQGVTLWSGVFEGRHDVWLRWCDREGNVLLTGSERAQEAEQRAEQAEQRASLTESQLEQTSDQLEQEKQRTQLLAERLLALGIDPDSL
ncbi:MAG: hypothetical protein EBE86_012265 [Hormoscilla sp. GUM202]|nr:hypothetical protein [Hormoscilla sp. GUM202]